MKLVIPSFSSSNMAMNIEGWNHASVVPTLIVVTGLFAHEIAGRSFPKVGYH